MGQKCSQLVMLKSGKIHIKQGVIHGGGANTGDPRFSGHGSSAGGGGMPGSNECIAMPH